MTKHTPGPWHADLLPVEGDKRRAAFIYSGADDETRIDICEVLNHHGKKQKEANATLIAAAPEMLAALHEVTERLEAFMHIASPDDISEGDRKAVAAALAIITKAKGN